jgi:amidase
MQRLSTYSPSADFPPKSIESDDEAVGQWYQQVFAKVPVKEVDPTMTQRERELYAMSAREYADARCKGDVTCEEYARALVKRVRYYRYLNQWIFNSYDLLDKMLVQAKALDSKAAAEGVDSIGPLYGLPIPMKGTAAVVDYPSGSGVGVLSGYVPTRDSNLTQLIKERGGVIFGATNVPEFAASYQTCNRASGQTRNVYGHGLTVGGSSGGAASAVAGYMCPLAVTEDTGGSTRVPASCNQNFGFDPSRNHYNNEGNPGMSYTCDQLGIVEYAPLTHTNLPLSTRLTLSHTPPPPGINGRSIEDIIWYDKCLVPKLAAQHEEARHKVRRCMC